MPSRVHVRRDADVRIFAGNKSSKRGPSKDDRALLAKFDKAVTEAEKWYDWLASLFGGIVTMTGG